MTYDVRKYDYRGVLVNIGCDEWVCAEEAEAHERAASREWKINLLQAQRNYREQAIRDCISAVERWAMPKTLAAMRALLDGE